MAAGKVHHSPKVATTFPLQEEVEDGKNRHVVKCQQCPSRILNPGMGVYKQVEVTTYQQVTVYQCSVSSHS
jgi:DNA-directed RNA polymerase subunit RPC12/RpoP